MAKYAKGLYAVGECARSGRKMKLRDMVTDPRTGMLVDPAWKEPPEVIAERDLVDGISLHRTAPDRDVIGTEVYFGEIADLSGNVAAPLYDMTECTPPTLVVT